MRGIMIKKCVLGSRSEGQNLVVTTAILRKPRISSTFIRISRCFSSFLLSLLPFARENSVKNGWTPLSPYRFSSFMPSSISVWLSAFLFHPICPYLSSHLSIDCKLVDSIKSIYPICCYSRMQNKSCWNCQRRWFSCVNNTNSRF